MIEQIDIRDPEYAEQIWRLQHLSYPIEAQLIGFADLPPLMDSVQSLMDSKEIFYAKWLDDELAGALSFTREGDDVDICRMMVHPQHFRKGIASSLLSYLFQTNADAKQFIVCTGERNEPAVQLYRRLGFVDRSIIEPTPGVKLIQFVKR